MIVLRAFWARLMANKVMTGLGLAFAASTAVLACPKSIGWLPIDLQHDIFEAAHYCWQAAIGTAFFFIKQHGAVGDPAGLSAPKVPQQPPPAGVASVPDQPQPPKP